MRWNRVLAVASLTAAFHIWADSTTPAVDSPSGAQPVPQDAVPCEHPDQGQAIKLGIPATTPKTPEILNQIMDLTDAMWTLALQGEAQGKIRRTPERGYWFNRLTCKNPGKESNMMQLWGPMIRETSGCLLLRLRVRSTKPFKLGTVEIMLNQPPWTMAMQGQASHDMIGKKWQTIEILLFAQEKVELPYMHINLGAMIPADAVFDFSPLGLWRTNH